MTWICIHQFSRIVFANSFHDGHNACEFHCSIPDCFCHSRHSSGRWIRLRSAFRANHDASSRFASGGDTCVSHWNRKQFLPIPRFETRSGQNSSQAFSVGFFYWSSLGLSCIHLCRSRCAENLSRFRCASWCDSACART